MGPLYYFVDICKEKCIRYCDNTTVGLHAHIFAKLFSYNKFSLKSLQLKQIVSTVKSCNAKFVEIKLMKCLKFQGTINKGPNTFLIASRLRDTN